MSLADSIPGIKRAGILKRIEAWPKMLTEKFVGFAVRKKLDQYLRFDPHTAGELPLVKDKKKTL